MDTIKEIVKYLNERCTNDTASYGAYGSGLMPVHGLIFNKRNLPKAELVKNLSEFYADSANIIGIWNGLSECERDFVKYIVQYNGNEHLPTTIEYTKKHNLTLEYTTRVGYKRDILDDYEYRELKFLTILKYNIPDTKAMIFFPSGRDMPPFVLKALKEVVEPMKFEYDEYTPSKKDYVICRENRTSDFASIVKFSSSERLKVKVDTFDLPKAKLAKIAETLCIEEVCDGDGKFCTPKETRRSNDFKVTQPLFVLAANSRLLEIDSIGNILPGRESIKMLSMPYHELAKKLRPVQ